MSLKIALLPGDGIGPEVTAEAVRILKNVAEHARQTFTFSSHKIGGVAIDSDGMGLPERSSSKVAPAMGTGPVLLSITTIHRAVPPTGQLNWPGPLDTTSGPLGNLMRGIAPPPWARAEPAARRPITENSAAKTSRRDDRALMRSPQAIEGMDCGRASKCQDGPRV